MAPGMPVAARPAPPGLQRETKALSCFQTPGVGGNASNHSGIGLHQWGEGAGRRSGLKGERRVGEGSLEDKAQISGGIVHFLLFFW